MYEKVEPLPESGRNHGTCHNTISKGCCELHLMEYISLDRHHPPMVREELFKRVNRSGNRA